jgi:hypothetical protein
LKAKAADEPCAARLTELLDKYEWHLRINNNKQKRRGFLFKNKYKLYSKSE